jgi:hypothetical protein
VAKKHEAILPYELYDSAYKTIPTIAQWLTIVEEG